MPACRRCGRSIDHERVMLGKMDCSAHEIDKNGWSVVGEDSFRRFIKDRTDISNTFDYGRVLYVYFTDDDEVGILDKISGYWSWIDRNEARKHRREMKENDSQKGS